MRPDIRSMTREALAAMFATWQQPSYRVDQVLHWIYQRRVSQWASMTNLPQMLRAHLAEEFHLAPWDRVRIQGAKDVTRKFLWRLPDRALIESVLIPASPALYGDPSDRHTLCLSSQVGCAYGCTFCASGLDGWKRNLGPEEIVGQVLAVEQWHDETLPRTVDPPTLGSPSAVRLVSNLVIMGMGEPLANYDNLLQALRILNAPWGCGMGARKITVSTSGLAPQIRRLAEEPLQFRLAVSLHGATDAIRDQIMPVNRKYPLRELVAACVYYQEKKGRMITLEYILMAGINDHPPQAKPLAELARRLHAKVNLIPYNTVEGLPWKRPDPARQESFLHALQRAGAAATLRREKGHDIDAACGQLRLRTERQETGKAH